jgi:hypothetical protein
VRLGDDGAWSILVEFRKFGLRKEITCGPVPVGDDLFAWLRMTFRFRCMRLGLRASRLMVQQGCLRA